jgi:hypothetical protein
LGVDSIVWLDWPLLVAIGLAGRSYNVITAERPTILTSLLEGSGMLARSPADPGRSIPRFPHPPLVEPVVTAHAYASVSLGTPEGALLVGAMRLRWHDAEFERAITELGTRPRASRTRSANGWQLCGPGLLGGLEACGGEVGGGSTPQSD